jgi:protein disulfide-isomerase A6
MGQLNALKRFLAARRELLTGRVQTFFAGGVRSFVPWASAGAKVLTNATFDKEVSGKGAFVKFYAPWCGHCKSMKPAWDQLGDEFADSKTVVIGDVDCTVETDLCGKLGVKGYPTVKYFTGNPEGETYEGGRDFESLKTFAAESLGPSCSFENLDLCDEEKKAFFAEWFAKGADIVKAAVEEKDAAVKKLESDYKEGVKGLQEKYEGMKKEKDDGIKALEDDLKMLKSIKSESKDGKL